MTGEVPYGSDCSETEEDLVELALGTLTGRRRAEALAHLEGCPRCAAEVEELSRTADQLLHVAQPVEPPVGFESRLFDKLGVDQAHPRRAKVRPFSLRPAERRRTASLGAAAAVIAAVGFGVGGLVLGHHAPVPAQSLDVNGWQSTAQLVATSSHQRIGAVYTYPGKPAWLFMTVDDGTANGWVECEVRVAGGKVVDLGTFRLVDGYGSWASPVPVPLSSIRTAQIVSGKSQVIATGSLQAT